MAKIDGITLEVMKNSFYTIAEEMGVTLIKTALSTNIKDRVDCSTALYTKDGELVAQAEHVPLHLGLMPSVVKEVLKMFPEEDLKPGDAILINDPYISGSHLPDIFMVSPIFHEGKLIAIASNVAHHVDVGGLAPGSMSVKATEIFQEGLRLSGVRVRKEGALDTEIIRLLKSNVRTGDEVLGDIYAQLAANSVAEQRLKDLIDKYSLEHIFNSMEEIINYSDRRMRAAVKEVPDGEYEFEDVLEGDGITEDDILVRTKVIVHGDEITVDFTGTNPQTTGPMNSTIGVTSACVYYAIKSLLEPDVPPNAGTYKCLNIVAPEGTIVNPKFPAPVSNANLNTSQRIADTIFGAMADVLPERSMAACSGTMTGFSIGGYNQEEEKYFSYVETYGGGQGALDDIDGMDGVHTNMTNTLNTPVEVIEQSFPFTVKNYCYIDGSGGPGRHRGGTGLQREIQMLEDGFSFTLTADRAKYQPWGLFGGEGGQTSQCTLFTSDGEEIKIKSKETRTVQKGDSIRLQTAGGGGYGDPKERSREAVERDIALCFISEEQAEKEYSYKK
ncbi:hydantoinase B/oxoprolinase family protein [Salinicoccus halitifaciens]|uniref:N-methylhydantoinase B n=1 Tax=Salinicoccus halitifaciens TaxID=1073415 RepID=A0ABV2EAS9_9STAP|nr:hydantoinase B/oxoprolinase family protein [Salinicoccus halitifaciens]MCD2138556.1 hydantoinase B/oxoprolinase family protein [Salinicoccus halitifaciens]